TIIARIIHQLCDIPDNIILDMNLLNKILRLANLLRRHYGLHLLEDTQRKIPLILSQNIRLLFVRGVSEPDTKQESIQLCLRKTVCSLLLNRVLRRDYQKWILHRISSPVDSNLLLLHHLKQRRLGLRRGPVDLVDQHEIRKDRSPNIRKLRGLEIENRRTGNVSGHKIRRKLNA